MYPNVTQFETRDRLILDELRVREERRLARMLKITQAELRG